MNDSPSAGIAEPNVHDDALGPVNYVVVEFPGGRVTIEGFQSVIDLVHAGTIGVLDLEFFEVTANRSLVPLDSAAVGETAGLDLSDFEGASSSLLDDDDGALLGRASAGSIVAVLVWEDLFLVPALAAWEHAGAHILGEGPILPDDLEAALDTAETLDRKRVAR